MLSLLRKNKLVIIFSFSFILIGLVINDYINDSSASPNLRKEEIKDFFAQGETNYNIPNNKYVAILEIPKINLLNGLVDKNSADNTIEKNIKTMGSSNMPDIKYGSLILLAHSGNSKIAYFNNLHKLKINDEIFIYYQNLKYIYRVFDIYDILKNGELQLENYPDKTILSMITCRVNTNKQIIILSELVGYE